MRKLLIAFLLFPLLHSCNNANNSQPAVVAAADAPATPLALNTPQYHRYTGTLAGQQVIVNMQVQPQKPGDAATAYIVSGSYYYVGKSRMLELTPMGERKTGDTIVLTENVEGEYSMSADVPQPVWQVKLDSKGLHGKWTSADGKTVHHIDLAEQYEAGSYPLNVTVSADSAVVTRRSGRNTMQVWFMLMAPTAQWKPDEAAFVTKALLHDWRDDSAKEIADYVAHTKQNVFADYRKTLKEMEGISGGGGIDDHSYTQQMACEYNAKGMLVLATTTYMYSGGAHGNYGTAYTCLDVQEKKVWQMTDVVADTNAMPKLLETSAKALYKMTPQQKLSEMFFVDTIKPSTNIAISDMGITFHYQPYEIAAYAAGEIALFVPYESMLSYLTPAFRKRMGK